MIKSLAGVLFRAYALGLRCISNLTPRLAHENVTT